MSDIGVPIRISGLNQISDVPLMGEFVLSYNGLTYKATIEQLQILFGGSQSLIFDADTGVLSISGGNDVTLTPTTSPRLTTSSASTFVDVPPGVWLDAFVIKSTVSGTFSMSLVSGAHDLLSGETVTTAWSDTFNRQVFGGDAGVRVYFEGLTGTVTIQLKYGR